MTPQRQLRNLLDDVDTIYAISQASRRPSKTWYIRLFIAKNNKVVEITQLVGKALNERTMHDGRLYSIHRIRRTIRAFENVEAELLDQISETICTGGDVKRFRLEIL